MTTRSSSRGVATALQLVPTNTCQAKRLALLHGPDRWWKPPLTYCLASPARFDLPRLELALRLLARRHNGLRTFFLPDESIDVAGCLSEAEASWPLEVVTAGADRRAAQAVAADAYARLQRDFDPFERPLVRALLLRRAETDVLGLSIEHSLFDGYSARVLIEDLAHVYEGLRTLPDSAFDTTASDAVRFAREERSWLDGPAGASALAWWDRQNTGLGPYPRLSLPQAGPVRSDATTAVCSVPLPARDVATFRRRAARLRLSAFMMAATAAAAALGESGTTEAAFLFANFRRTWPSTARLVGYTANRSLLRLEVSPDASVSALAPRMRGATLEAIEHGMLSHEQYLRMRFPAAYERQPSVPYLHLNVMERRPVPNVASGDWSLVDVPGRTGVYQTPGIAMNLVLSGDGTGALHSCYADGLYEPAVIERFTRAVVRHALESG